MIRYEIEMYETEGGYCPFQVWLDAIPDKIMRTLVFARIRQAELGNLGDWKYLAGSDGVYEFRIHYGQGFRVYFHVYRRRILLLLAGSSKRDQDRTIGKAKLYLQDFKRRAER